jgi:NAD(P)-dependent dehydrogenase (short-subunit alcohol dehydrogenase family)
VSIARAAARYPCAPSRRIAYADQGVRVTAVGPGFIRTPGLVAFFAGDAASFVTGSYHLVEGGHAAR